MLQLRVELPDDFELEDGVLSQRGIEWLNIYQSLFEKNGFKEFKVVNVKT